MTDYVTINKMADSLLEGIQFNITLLSNASALLWQEMGEINWAGFYLAKAEKLILGPFQGKPACTVIEKGKGVCGTAFLEDKTQLVENVHEFPGHIACDSASNSEIVIPIHRDNLFYGVLDIDSPYFSRFLEEDQKGLEKFVEILEKHITNDRIEGI